MNYKWKLSIRQHNHEEYPTLFESIMFETNDISDVQNIKDALELVTPLYKTEIVVETVEVEDEK